MKFFFISLFICLFSFSTSALTELDMPFVYKLLDAEEGFYKAGNFVGERGKILKYTKFGRKKGSKGALVFVSGRSENLFKYTELFYDLNLLGYYPIYTYDHRGQGFSERIKNSKFSYVESYDNYVKDLNTFIETIVLQDSEVHKEHLFLISHSMGGTISSLYLEEYASKKTFKAAIFSAPLIKIETKMPFILERIALVFFRAICLFKCASPAWNPNLPKSKSELIKMFTTSKNRWKFSSYLIKKYPKVLTLRPTYKWAIETFKATDKLLEKDRVKKIRTPILLIQAAEDRLVSNKHQVKFCNMIPDLCQLQIINSGHEIFMNKDVNRNKAIRSLVNFFHKNK